MTPTKATSGKQVDPDGIPADLRGCGQWVLWRAETRGGDATKVPYQVDGSLAASDSPATWTTFENACTAYRRGRYDGIGFVFSADDPFFGVDLDGCRDPSTGVIATWAQEVIDAMAGTYCEISPSGTGVKLWARGKSPFDKGVNEKLPQFGAMGSKVAGIEIYDHKRYFAMTGWKLPDADCEPCGVPDGGMAPAKKLIDGARAAKKRKSKSDAPTSATHRATSDDRQKTVERCRAYVAKIPEAVSGQGGHPAAFKVACVLFRFGLTDSESRQVFDEYNQRCQPPWDDREVEHKLHDAREEVTAAGEFNSMLRDDRPRSHANVGESFGATDDHTVATTATESGKEPPSFTRLMTSAELLDLDCSITYLVDDVMVENQPLVIGGASKTLKTGVMVDMAVSLATGSPFLNRFTAQRRRVAIWSGESGAPTLKNLSRRIACSKGIDLRVADLFWNFEVPKLSWHDHLKWMEKTIVDNGLQVIVVDPLYLALLDAKTASLASNVYAMGSALLPLTELGRTTGCTIVVLHHFKRSAVADDAEPAALESLSQSGIVEWARQWILLQRRSPYQNDGRHELWMRAGGSAGHASLWALDANEGQRDKDAPDGDGRYWAVDLRSVGDARQAAQDEAEERKQRRAQDRQAAQDAVDVERLSKAMATYPDGQTLRAIRDAAGLSGAKAGKALATMIGTGHAVPCKVSKNGREEDGFRYVEKPGSIGGTRWDSPTESHPVPARWDRDSIEESHPTATVPPSHRTQDGEPVPPLVSPSGRVLAFDAHNQRGQT